jgi:protein TonB
MSTQAAAPDAASPIVRNAEPVAEDRTPATASAIPAGRAVATEPSRSGPVIAAIEPPGNAPGPITELARPRGGYQVRPSYPSAARKARVEGTTLLRVLVSAEGRIDDVQVQRSAGHAALDEAAANAVRRWRFEPAHSGPTAVAMWVVIPVEFRLEGGF